MSSTILYKFRSGTTFEALPLPGSAARLFDVKKAIVAAKKLDQGAIEFDLSIRDATTNQEYTDETMLLPRGTRVIVQRLPAAKGHGFLARMARSQYAITQGPPGAPIAPSSAPSNFYTIDAPDDDEDFVTSGADEKELAALRAATEAANASTTMSKTGVRLAGGRPAGQGPPQQQHQRAPASGGAYRARPNADPELREQEKQLMPKKRATGIPRTFLNLSAPPATDGGEGESNVPLLQPNAIGFEELLQRGGGQSESVAGSKRNLDYALKLTATTIPDYLQCAICHSVVRDAMILPWDPEGRTTCESCIRDALTQNGYRCPLTGQEGVSPDDLLPNHALRKAAEQFINVLIEKVEEVEKQQVDEDDYVQGGTAVDESGILEGESGEKGVLVSKRASVDRKKRDDSDLFGLGGDDDFGGDVFAVEPVHKPDDNAAIEGGALSAAKNENSDNDQEQGKLLGQIKQGKDEGVSPKQEEKPSGGPEQPDPGRQSTPRERGRNRSRSPARNSPSDSNQAGLRRENPKRRGPPVGYSMGPAISAVDGPHERDGDGKGHSPRMAGGRSDSLDGGYNNDRPHWGRGRGGRYDGRFPSGRYESRGPARDDVRIVGICRHPLCSPSNICSFPLQNSTDNPESRGMKRGRSSDHEPRADDFAGRDEVFGGRGPPVEFRGRGRFRGGGRGNWDDNRGRAGGRWDDNRGRAYRGGRGGFRGGRGRY